MTRFDEIKKQHAKRGLFKPEIDYLLAELERTQARLAKAEAVCKQMLTFVPSLLVGYSTSRFKKEFVDPWRESCEYSGEHGGG